MHLCLGEQDTHRLTDTEVVHLVQTKRQGSVFWVLHTCSLRTGVASALLQQLHEQLVL